MNVQRDINDIVNQKVTNITATQGHTMVEFADGSAVTLSGVPTPIQVHVNQCIFCGNPGSLSEPLFTNDNEHYICKQCVHDAVEAYKNFGDGK